MRLLCPENFADYELIDCGNFEKLERFGKYVTIRPEPQAIWNKKLSEKDWEKKADVRFVSKSSSAGMWQKKGNMPDQWTINYSFNHLNHKAGITLRLGLTSFKHVGVFPEQAVNWDFIFKSIKKINHPNPKVLNLFAYTGAASLASKAAGADVVHLDSIKQVVSWARQNMELSNLDNIRWLVEDAMTFVNREVKRGNKYQGIILDPPAYGHGPDGESWKLENMINDMMGQVKKLLDKEHFLVLNTYSLGFSALLIENMMDTIFDKNKNREFGEIYLPSTSGFKLPLGVYSRYVTS
ncbi:MAG: class I SAM-dependent methyltransferase [Bacteroidetes bacterium]|nr:class I SAM-dependent methyltransferase [Bacteroidota bacterium]